MIYILCNVSLIAVPKPQKTLHTKGNLVSLKCSFLCYVCCFISTCIFKINNKRRITALFYTSLVLMRFGWVFLSYFHIATSRQVVVLGILKMSHSKLYALKKIFGIRHFLQLSFFWWTFTLQSPFKKEMIENRHFVSMFADGLCDIQGTVYFISIFYFTI